MADPVEIITSDDRCDPISTDDLFRIVYGELKRLATRHMKGEAADHSLQPTALVHEAWLRLTDQQELQSWDSPEHFYAAAAESMRRILVDSARRRNSLKRGGDRRRLPFDECTAPGLMPDENLLALDEALERFAEKEPVKAELVKLRYFAGLSHQDAAKTLCISRATADRYWAYAKVWLFVELQQSG